MLSLFNRAGDFLGLVFTVLVASVTRISVDEDLDLLLLALIFGDKESFFSGSSGLSGLLFLLVPFLLLVFGIGSAPI